MNKFEELKINVQALHHVVKDEKKFFTSIFQSVEELNKMTKNGEEIDKDKILFFATKIEDFFEKYRATPSYSAPVMTSRSDDTVRSILSLSKELSKLSDTELDKLILPKKNKLQKIVKYDKSKVFIVHGHDNEIKTEVARFIEKLGLEAIIIHEQASSGKTIIEKIESFSNVGFAIILYTPDDVGALASSKKNLKPRGRQNVVFEHGFLIGKLGRNKVTTVVKGNVELPNDISGVVYISNESWKIDIAKELKAANYKIDFNKLF
jgi:predicted nucleotide-binding protein